MYLNQDAADKLSASAGDTVRVFAGRSAAEVRVKAIVRFDGAGADGAAVLMPLSAAQTLLHEPGRIKYVLVSNRGGAISGAAQTGPVVKLLRPVLTPLGLQANKTKQDTLKLADMTGAAFVSMFTTFGSFSIAAGILLIFLIFIMLAAERRGELGIARAVGTRQRHLVEMFLFEGVAYDIVAAAIGVLLGIGVAYVMVLVMAGAFEEQGGLHITYSVTPRTVIVAYALGMLLSLAVVCASAWRVSRMNIVTAIRSLPDPPAKTHTRKRWLLGAAVVVVGAALIAAGIGSRNAITLGFGVSLTLLGAVPVAERFGAPQRLARTAAGLGLVAWFVLPVGRWLFGTLSLDFSIFILSGLMIVVGASWTLMYNADLLVDGVTRTFGRIPRLAPVLRMSMAYPLRNRFRTGVTIAMFTLVVFTLVTGATTTTSFVNGMNNMGTYGGGFDIRATVAPAGPIPDMHAALQHAPGLDPAEFRTVSSQSFLPVKARQVGGLGGSHDYAVRGLDPAFLTHTTYGLAARADGYASDRQVWNAINRHRGLAVVDGTVAPRRTNFNFGAAPPFQLHGFYVEDEHFHPVVVVVRDPQTGRSVKLTVIGVLSDTAPLEMAGILDVTAHARRHVRTTRPTHRVPVRAPTRRRPGRDVEAARVSLPRQRHAGRRRQDAARRRRCRLAHVRPSDHGVHGARPDRRRHRPGCDQRPLRRRTPSADRRPASDRIPPPNRAVELPAGVLVHRAHLDRDRHRARPRRRPQRHPRLAATTELEQPQLRPAVADHGGDLRGRLPRRVGDHLPSRPPSCARLSGGGSEVPVAARPDRARRFKSCPVPVSLRRAPRQRPSPACPAFRREPGRERGGELRWLCLR